MKKHHFNYIWQCSSNRIKNGESVLNDSIGKWTNELYFKILNRNKFILTEFNDTKLFFIISNFISAPKSIKRTKWCKKDKKFMKKIILTLFIYILYIWKELIREISLSVIMNYEEAPINDGKEFFLHLIDISIVNSFIIYKKSEFNKGIT